MWHPLTWQTIHARPLAEAEQHQRVMDEVNERRAREERRRRDERDVEERRQFEEEAARPDPPMRDADVVFHRAVQTERHTKTEFTRSESTQTMISGPDVYAALAPSLSVDYSRGRARRRGSGGEKTQAPVWGRA
jgi:hypothetical protein